MDAPDMIPFEEQFLKLRENCSPERRARIDAILREYSCFVAGKIKPEDAEMAGRLIARVVAEDAQDKCDHPDFEANVAVSRILDVKRYIAEVTIHCKGCGLPFRFIGMELGMTYDIPRMSVDGLEARLPIGPANQIPSPIKGVTGFDIKPKEGP